MGTDFFACGGLYVWESERHAPKGQKRIAQGKRSDTLGKP